MARDAREELEFAERGGDHLAPGRAQLGAELVAVDVGRGELDERSPLLADELGERAQLAFQRFGVHGVSLTVLALTWSSTHAAATSALAVVVALLVRTVLKLRDRVTRLEALDERDRRGVTSPNG